MRIRFRLPLCLVAGAILALASFAPAAQAISFDPPVNYAVGTGPQSILAADFNADTFLDLAVVNEFSYSVSVFVGGGNGTFGGRTDYGVGTRPLAIETGNFDGNSDPDLVVVNERDDNVSVFTGATGAGFNGPVNYPVGLLPQSVVVADFNGDSDDDIAVANGDSNDISVLTGATGATFTGPVNFPNSGFFPLALTVDDFNGDSDPDLAAANELSNDVAVLLGASGSGFGSPTSFPAGANPRSIAKGDFNGDSDPDLAVVNELSHDASILLGASGGSFTGPASFAAGSLPDSVAVGDFNRDSDPDLAVANLGSNNVSVLLGQSGGTFTAPENFTAADGPSSIAVADFNRDNYPDMAVTNEISNVVSILLGAPPTADLSIAMTDAPDPVNVGSNITYSLDVANAGSSSATSVTVTDSVPSGMTYQSSSASQGSCTQSSGVVTCNLGTLASSASATVQIVLRPQNPGNVTNTASVQALEPDPAPGNNSAQAVTTAVSTSYPRPGGASPLRVPLVPEFQQCVTPTNARHVLPLDLGSCSPPQLRSSQLTTGYGSGSGYARLDVIPGNTSTTADEADVRVIASATDVRTAGDADYTGSVALASTIRITDRANGANGTVAGTVADTDLGLPVSCTATADPARGSTCGITTTLDTQVPGLVKESKRMIISAFSIRVLDAGADASLTPPSGTCPPKCGSGDESVYLRQGAFLP
jgi:uncharacterized repeat protein (TIGR01451 family)